MKITLKQLKKLVEGIMSDNPEFPEKTDLKPTVDLLKSRNKRSEDFEKYQLDMEDSFEKASQLEPESQSNMMLDFESILLDKGPDSAELFVMMLYDVKDSKYIGQFFDLSRGTIKLRPPYQKMISDEKEKEIYDIIRRFGEKDPIFGKVIRNERERSQLRSFDQKMKPREYFETQVRALFSTNELRVLDNQFRPLIQGQRVICDWNAYADQVCISFPDMSPGDLPSRPFLGNERIRHRDGGRIDYEQAPYPVPSIDLGGIHFFWFMANQKTEFNKTLEEYDGDIWEAYEDLQDRQHSGQFGSNIYHWFPKMAAYCAIYASSVIMGLEWLGAEGWIGLDPDGRHPMLDQEDEDSIPVGRRSGMGIPYLVETEPSENPTLDLILDMAGEGGIQNIYFSDFPSFVPGQNDITSISSKGIKGYE